MRSCSVKKLLILLLAAVMMMTPVLCSCSDSAASGGKDDRSSYIAVILDEPDTVDFQCTTLFYDTAYCVYDRLVDTVVMHNGSIATEPSLARYWEVSEDGRTYTFHLNEGVKFSNGSPLTSSDVGYTLTRLLTHPDSRNRDIAEPIKGAQALEEGRAKTLAGFKVISDTDFSSPSAIVSTELLSLILIGVFSE